LTPRSGPGATYCFRLGGTALAKVAAFIAPSGSRFEVYKVGFSNDPGRRRNELNAYLPDASTLTWEPVWEQWHRDEINAWAMEQEVFNQLKAMQAKHIKGEIFAATEDAISGAWTAAMTTTRRPTGPVTVTIGHEEQIAAATASAAD
jgi:hypothetical protein